MNRGGGDGSLLRRINCVAVLRTLHGGGELTLRELAERAGVSRNTAEDAVVTLVDRGLVAEVSPEDDGNRPVGRPAKRYRFRPDAGVVLGADFAVHESNVLVVDLYGNLVGRYSAPADPDATADERVRAAGTVLRQAVRTSGVRQNVILAVGVATTGIVTPEGRVLRSERLPRMEGRELASDLAVFGDTPVIVGNDARLATVAEHWRGAATGFSDVVNILAGRHITAGIVLGGKVLHGTHGAAGEVGTLPQSLWRSALDEIAAWPDAPEAVFALAEAGDRAAMDRVDSVAHKLATGVATVVLAVDPQCVIVSGGLSGAGATLLDPLQRHLDALTLFSIPVLKSTLDHDAVAFGAARLALDHVERQLFDADSAI
ncbi:MAG TPA: ROK family transcriptional regulator [Actinokineospora sp.]|jgi:predicted NBD/HSP70 family sugar kinase|nr:ROK family transcriptional regulator [Actinokineospora sp.]